MDVAALRAKIRDIKNFPTEGILFKDITTLLKDGPAWRFAVDSLASHYQTDGVEIVVGVESRGFIFGGAIAHQLNAGFVPVRKLGKLPGKTIEVEYELEYGRDALAMHEGRRSEPRVRRVDQARHGRAPDAVEAAAGRQLSVRQHHDLHPARLSARLRVLRAAPAPGSAALRQVCRDAHPERRGDRLRAHGVGDRAGVGAGGVLRALRRGERRAREARPRPAA